jgi:hypothetical protein
MSNRIKSKSSPSAPKPFVRTIRFPSRKEALLIQRAADYCGLSFNRFVANSAISWADTKLKQAEKEGR